MKYLLLIHQGDTPLPGTPEWERFSQDEQNAVYGDYQAVNQTAGSRRALWLQPPEVATTVRVEDGKTLTTDGRFVAVKKALGGYLIFEADDLDSAIAPTSSRRWLLSSASSSTATTTCTRPAPNCCAGSTGSRKPRRLQPRARARPLGPRAPSPRAEAGGAPRVTRPKPSQWCGRPKRT